MFRRLLLLLTLLTPAALSAADETSVHHVHFAKGRSDTTLSGTVTGRQTHLYKIHASSGQFLNVTLSSSSGSTQFNIYIPGRGPGSDALFTSDAGGNTYTGQLYKTGEHTISVFLNRAAARRGESATFKLSIRVTDSLKPSRPTSPSAAKGGVPPKVIEDCLAALAKQTSGAPMKVLSARRGENSFIVDIQVRGAEKPWRCYHDGRRCTGTEYQGEG